MRSLQFLCACFDLRRVLHLWPGRRAYRGLFAASAGPLGACFPHIARPPDEGTGLGGDYGGGSRQRLSATSIFRLTMRVSPSRRSKRAARLWNPGVDLGEILCVQEERQVGNDNCVSFNRLKLQIPASPLRPHFVKARVKVRQYHNGSHAVFHGPRCLGRYDRKGAPVEHQKAA